MNNIKVSVIMPSLNTVDYIEESIKSVLNQTLKELELICVDAGSTDGTLEIIKKLKKQDKRIKLINSDIKSYGYQMNLGIKAATGEFLGIVEPDDFMLENAYEELYCIIRASGAEMVRADYYNGRENTEGVFEKRLQKLLVNKTLSDMVINPRDHVEVFLVDVLVWTGLYNRRWLLENNILFNESQGASFQDNGFMNICMTVVEKLWFSSKAFYVHREDNPNSSINNQSKIYCTCEEMRYFYKRLSKNREKLDIYKYVIRAKFLKGTRYHLSRISTSFMKEFINKCHDDFLDYSKNMGVYSLDEKNISKFHKPYMIGLVKYPNELADFWISKYTAVEAANNIMIYGTDKRAGEIWDDIKMHCMWGKVKYFVKEKTYDEEYFKGIPVIGLENLKYLNDDYTLFVAKKIHKEQLLSNYKSEKINIIEYTLHRSFEEYIYSLENELDKALVSSEQEQIFVKNQCILDTVQKIFGNNETAKSLEQRFIKRYYTNVVIYGYGVLGKVVVRELRDSRVKIIAVMDSTPEKVTGIPDEMPLLSPNDKMPEYDAIIVTAVAAFEAIKKNLTAKDYKNIINILELV